MAYSEKSGLQAAYFRPHFLLQSVSERLHLVFFAQISKFLGDIPGNPSNLGLVLVIKQIRIRREAEPISTPVDISSWRE